MIVHRQIRGEIRRDFIIVDGSVQIAGGAFRFPAIQISLGVLRIDADRSIIFGNSADDVVPAKAFDALLDVFSCGLRALGGDRERKRDQKTNCDQEQAFHLYLVSCRQQPPAKSTARTNYWTVAGNSEARRSDAIAKPFPIWPIIP